MKRETGSGRREPASSTEERRAEPDRPGLTSSSGATDTTPEDAGPEEERPLEASEDVPAEEGGSSPVALAKLDEADPDAPGHRISVAEKDILSVTLPAFEGPLDLLLHLVREHRLDIFDIPVSFITRKYVEMLDRMRDLNLDVAGEFLVMAATLAQIKSRMLLPVPEPEEGGESEYEMDPREELVRRLLAYQKYREAAAALGAQEVLGRDVFVRRGRSSPPPSADGDTGLASVGVFRLIESLDQVLSRSKVKVSHEVIRERLSLADRLTQVTRLLVERRRMSFRELFADSKDTRVIVISFLALLEMSRLGLARLVQEEPGSDITLICTEEAVDVDAIGVRDDFQ